jgi:hypothetical protein
MGGLSLLDALSLCELLAKSDPTRYEGAALRSLKRFIDGCLSPLVEVRSLRQRWRSFGMGSRCRCRDAETLSPSRLDGGWCAARGSRSRVDSIRHYEFATRRGVR